MAEQEKKPVRTSRTKKVDDVVEKEPVKKTTKKTSGADVKVSDAKTSAVSKKKSDSTVAKESGAKKTTARKKTAVETKGEEKILADTSEKVEKNGTRKVSVSKDKKVNASESLKEVNRTRKTADSEKKVKPGVSKKTVASKKTDSAKIEIADVETKKSSAGKISSSVEKDIPKVKASTVKAKKVTMKETDLVPFVEKSTKISSQDDSALKKIDEELREEPVFTSTLPVRRKSEPVFRTSEVAILVLIACVISLLLGAFVTYRFVHKDSGRLEVADAELQNFIQDYNYLVDNYYGKVDKKEILNVAFKAMVNSLDDTYSGTIDDSSNSFDINLKGSYTGLGVEIVNDKDGNIVIYRIFEDSPAGRSELMAGDVLLKVNDHDVRGTSTSEFVKTVQDDTKQQFELLVKRGEEEKLITVKKEFITLPSVVSKTFDRDGKKIGYLGVSIFAANTATQFHDELRKLESAGMDGLVIDLRGNSGGHLFAVENMIAEFLDSSHVIYQEEVKDQKNKVYSSGTKTKEYPISILINGSSASASEVMTAALMEEYGAVVVGTTSYGKGTVQELRELSNGDEYKFTTKKWLTPKGEWIHTKGIIPTVEVVLNGAYYSNPSDDTDNQLQEAISAIFK